MAPKRSKYRNIKTVVDGHKFDSKKEAARYVVLKRLEEAGMITYLSLQPKFKLLDQIKWNGKTLCKRSYVADFMYREYGETVVEDVKGMQTPMYRLKKHLFLSLYPQYRFIET